jgi:hypothetical protein
VFAAHTDRKPWLDRPGRTDRRQHQLAYRTGVQFVEGGLRDDAEVPVGRQQFAVGVVARQAPGGRREIVGTEGQEVAAPREPAGQQRGSRCLDHRAQRDVLLSPDPGQQPAHRVHFGRFADHRDEQPRPGITPSPAQRRGRLGQRAQLGIGQLWQQQAQPNPAHAEHRVVFPQPPHGGKPCGLDVLARCRSGGQLGEVGQELVPGRIEQPHHDRAPVHHLEQLGEVGPQQRLHLRQRLRGVGAGWREQHLFQQCLAFAEEHVLDAAQADTGRAEFAAAPGVSHRVGVDPYSYARRRSRVCQQDRDRIRQHGRGGGSPAGTAMQDGSGATVHCDLGSRHDRRADGRTQALSVLIDDDVDQRGHAWLAEATRDDGGMRRASPALGDHGRRSEQTSEVLRAGLRQHQHRLLPVPPGGDGVGRGEHHQAGRDAGSHSEPARDGNQITHVGVRHERFGQVGHCYGAQRLISVQASRGEHAGGTVQFGLVHPEHPQPPAFDHELHQHRMAGFTLGQTDSVGQLSAPRRRGDDFTQWRTAARQQLGTGRVRQKATG